MLDALQFSIQNHSSYLKKKQTVRIRAVLFLITAIHAINISEHTLMTVRITTICECVETAVRPVKGVCINLRRAPADLTPRPRACSGDHSSYLADSVWPLRGVWWTHLRKMSRVFWHHPPPRRNRSSDRTRDTSVNTGQWEASFIFVLRHFGIKPHLFTSTRNYMNVRNEWMNYVKS